MTRADRDAMVTVIIVDMVALALICALLYLVFPAAAGPPCDPSTALRGLVQACEDHHP
jgi:hypothetical protein